MTDSPSPIDSSFDASDVATPCTVIAAKTRNLRDLNRDENQSKGDEDEEEDEISAIYVGDFSKGEFTDDTSSVMEPLQKPPCFARTITKVYCNMDNEELPYMVEVHVPPDCITLRDVKRKLPRQNYKFFCIALDPDSGLEVKAELRDDSSKLYPLKDGRFQLFLLTVEGSVHSDTSSGRHRNKKTSSKGSSSSREHRHGYDYTTLSEVSSEASSLPTYVKKAQDYNRRQQPQYGDLRHQIHHKNHRQRHQKNNYNPYEESSLDLTESDVYGGGRDGETFFDEEDDDSRSINTDLTSVSQQHLKKKWREQQQKNKWRNHAMSTTSSSFTDITESSMGIEIITVRLNLETLPLGMIPCGDTDSRGDSGLFVGNIMDRGAVALDGRIDVGDMILEINGKSLQNYSNANAANLLKKAVQNQFLTLTIAKTERKKTGFIRNPRNEPVRPIDTNEWIKHATNAMNAMPSISEESSSTPIPDEWPSHSSASGTHFGGQPPTLNQLSVMTDKKYVVEVLAAPGSGLEIKDREWLKLSIPMSFLGRDLVDWLLDHVKGLQKREEAREYAEELLKKGYIEHVVNEKKFSEKRYYVMGEECADYTQLRAPDGGFKYPPSRVSSNTSNSTSTTNNNIFPPSMYPQQQQYVQNMSSTSSASSGSHHIQYQQQRNSVVLPNGIQQSVSGYASMPASPFPKDSGRTRDDQRSQTSGSSRGSSRRYVELPRKTSSQGSGDSSLLDRVASRSSFRAAMSGSLRQFSIDN